MDSSSAKLDLLDQLAEEFADRYRRGERPSLLEYQQRHPELADQISDLFPALAAVEQAEADRVAPAAPKPEAPAAPPLQQVGDYRVLRKIGEGGMGVVYEAEQVSLGRRVALKVLSARVLGDAKAQERFRREARSAARLHHTNIVPVFEVGQEGDVCYYAMQLIQGQGLDQVIVELRRLRDLSAGHRQKGKAGTPSTVPAAEPIGRAAQSLLTGQLGPPTPTESHVAAAPPPDSPPVTAEDGSGPPDRPPSGHSSLPAGHRPYFRSVARIGQQAAQALAHAHARRIVHRDVKPSNLLLDESGVVWVTDFGLAKVEDDNLTRTGELPGTLRYMAPERFQGRCDPRTDIYALGLTLYELLVLKPAFEASESYRLMDQILQQEPPRPRSVEAQVPRDLETIVLKAIDKEPRRRYPSAEELSEDLRRFLAHEPIRARRVTLPERLARWCQRNPAVAALAASVLVLLLAVAVVASVGYVRTSVALGKEAEQRAAAEREQAKATEEAARNRRLLYDADMQLAARLWESETGTARAVADLLEAHAGEEDLHDFTWRYQWRLLHDPPGLKGENPVLTAAVAPGGGLLTYDGSLLCSWDKTTRRETGRLSLTALPSRCCWRFFPAGTLLAVGTTDGRVHLYDTATGHERSFIQGAAPLKDLCFSPDGRKLATIHTDRQARAWDVATGKEVATFALRSPSGANAQSQPELFFQDCALAPDGRTLALASHLDHSQVTLYRAGQAEPGVLPRGTVTVNCVAFSPDGRTIASGAADNRVDLWDAATGRHRDSFTPHIGNIQRVAFSPDSTRLGTGSLCGFVSVWDLARRQRLLLFKGPTTEIADLAFSADGQALVATSRDGTARLWQLTERQESRTLLGAEPTLSRVAYSPDGQWLAMTRPITLWDARTGVLVRRLDAADSVAFSPDSKTLASGGRDSRVRLWDVGTGRLLQTLDGRPGEPDKGRRVVASLTFSPDGRWLAAGFGELHWFVGDHDQVVKVWDLASGQEAATLPHRNTVPSLAFSPDSATLATACYDRTVRLWAVGSWRPLRSWQGSETFDTLAFAPGGKTLATGSGDGTVQLWDPATGQALRLFGRYSHRTFDLAFSPDGKTLASASGDQTVKLWDVVSGRELRTLAEHTHWVFGVAFAPGGDVLASSSQDGTVRLWETRNRAEALADWLAREPEPDNAAAWVGRARAYLALNQPDRALAEATRAVKLRPDDPGARQARAEIYLGMKKWDEALRDYTELVKLQPDGGDLLTLRGNLYARCGKWAEAADDFRNAARLNGPDAALPWRDDYRRALAQLAAGNSEEYRKVCVAMVAHFQDTEDAQTASFTAWTCALGPGAVLDFAPVLRLAERALGKAPDLPLSHQAVGAVLYRMDRPGDALPHLQVGLAADNARGHTSPAYLYFFLAMAHHRLGHAQEARAWLEKAVAQTDKELRDEAQDAAPALWVRKATLQLLRAEAQALLRQAATGPAK
jgi:WD40 repeat protein/serine/threonine protein kinase/tetratricopeptide (TPR) repeat protein